MSMFDFMGNQGQIQQLQNDPIGMARKDGFQIPDNLANDPQAMVMHLVQTGQVSSPFLQRIMPMIQRMGK